METILLFISDILYKIHPFVTRDMVVSPISNWTWESEVYSCNSIQIGNEDCDRTQNSTATIARLFTAVPPYILAEQSRHDEHNLKSGAHLSPKWGTLLQEGANCVQYTLAISFTVNPYVW